MEDQAAQEEGEAEIQELHGPEHWFSQWERQCLAEAEQDDGGGLGGGGGGPLPPELQDDDEAAAAATPQPEPKQQKLWHLFQNSATAVAQLYKGERRPRRTCGRPDTCRRREGDPPHGGGCLSPPLTRVGTFGSGRRGPARLPPPGALKMAGRPHHRLRRRRFSFFPLSR